MCVKNYCHSNNDNAINNIIEEELANTYNLQFNDVKYSQKKSLKLSNEFVLIILKVPILLFVRNVLTKKEQYFYILI